MLKLSELLINLIFLTYIPHGLQIRPQIYLDSFLQEGQYIRVVSDHFPLLSFFTEYVGRPD